MATLPAAPQAGRTLDVTVHDQSNLAVPGVRLEVAGGLPRSVTAETGEDGRAIFRDIPPGRYRLSAVLQGFEKQEQEVDLTGAETVHAVSLTLVPATERAHVEVTAEASPVEQGATTSTTITTQLAKNLPDRPATATDALPLVPGVVREPGGALVISDSPEHRSALIVNSADVTDPATGQFGLTVPIDSVEAVDVFQTPYLAEYGRFTAGLVSVATRRGGDKWKWELNDPLPEFRIRSWHLRGLRTATPRLNFEGPILAHRLFLSEGFEYETRKTDVYTLPFPWNQKLDQGINSFTQIDWLASDRHMVTATLHLAPRRLGNWNIDAFDPIGTSPDARTHNYTGTLADRFTVGGAYWENTLSVTQFDASVWPKGPNDLVLAPSGNGGNYFASQQRTASRLAGLSNLAFAPLHALGEHHFKVGSYAAGSHEDGQVQEHPVQLLDNAGRLLERITFNRNRDFDISDVELNFFAQDHWIVTPRLSFDIGARIESQQISGAERLAPRFGFAWNPIPGAGTTLRGGAGLFYDRVPLNVYVFNRYPDQIATYYAPDGSVSAGPYLFLNTLGQVRVRHPFLFQEPKDGNFSPRSLTASLQLEQPLGQRLRLR
ncbi:MAG: TonB-dependent receptor, partial [Acidobacteriota bacterium]|nr:TonB-dependent receptor [Acidobacteriota bacterium]